MKKLLVLLTIVCISLTSCDVLSDLLDDPDTSEFFTLAENTKIYSEDEMEYFVKDSDRTLTISAEAPSETVPVVGDIIICPISESTPYGYMGKVISVEKTDAGWIMETEVVPLNEAFEELHINTELDISKYIESATDKDGNVIIPEDLILQQEAQTRGSGTVTMAKAFPVKNDFFEGELWFNYNMNLNVDISKFKINVFDIELEKQSGIQGDWIVAHVEKDFDYTLAEMEMEFAPVPIPSTPIFIVPVIYASWTFDGAAEMTLTADLTYTFEHQTYNLSYNKGKPKASSNDMLTDEDRNLQFKSLDMQAQLNMDITGGGKFGIYNEDLLSFGVELTYGQKYKIEDKITTDDEGLLNSNPTLSVGHSLVGSLYCESFLFNIAGVDDGRFSFDFPFMDKSLEIHALPQFSEIETGTEEGELTASATVEKLSLIKCQEKGFALFEKESEEPLEHLTFDVIEKELFNRDTLIFSIPNPTASYVAKPYVLANEKYYYFEEIDRWVDLGLPSGILWAAYNVGATSPEEYGEYYAWGETEEKETYTRENYKYKLREKEDEIPVIGTEISGTPYDVAHVKWGDGARMPIFDEFVELIMNCTYEVAQYNDTYGYYICGPNRKKIFLPFSGIKTNKHKYNYLGSFWSGTCGDFRDYAYDIQWGIYDSPPLYQEVSLDIGFDDEGDFYYNVCSLFDINDNCWLAFVGLPIRPVKDKQ